MKILVQSDDYGFTKGVIAGMCDAFENGIITSTGLFANMPCRDLAVQKMKEYPHICFGIDINVVSGPSVADPLKLPTLVNPKTGQFIQTSERLKDPDWGKREFKPYDECFIEAVAQIEKFIELTGRKPEYVTTHSSGGSRTYTEAVADAAKQFEIVFSKDVYAKYGIKMLFEKLEGDRYSYQNQTRNVEEGILRMLEENKDEEYINIPSHCGFCDAELLRLTRCNIERVMDHAMLTSPKIKTWIKEHNAQLVSYRDLPL